MTVMGKLTFQATAKFLVKQYICNNWIRHCYVLAKGVSIKIVLPVFPTLHKLIFEKLKLYLRKQYLYRDRSSFNPISERLYQIAASSARNFHPKVSVIIQNTGDVESLRERLNSIYRQTFANFEVIFFDDGLTDDSRDILKEYRERYPLVTTCTVRAKDSDTLVPWAHALTMAQGDLIWIADSDGYCSPNLLSELINHFTNEAVMLAFCPNVLADVKFSESAYNGKECAPHLNFDLGRDRLVMSANYLVNKVWTTNNNVPKIGSTVFRHPGNLELLNNKNWKQMKICRDWMFFLHLIRGGLVGYSPHATNYFRLRQYSAFSNECRTDSFYQEHEQIAKAIITMYQVETRVILQQVNILESLWRSFRTDYSGDSFKKCYDLEQVQKKASERKPNVVIASFALIAGGGETFPIKLANILKTAGYGITFLNCHKVQSKAGVRQMLRPDIPLLELDTLSKLGAVVDDMGIELVHSHHSWVDVCVSYFLEDHPRVQLVVTTHGIYEMTPTAVLAQIFPLLRKRVNKFVYLTDKNLPVFTSHQFDVDRFVKIGNAIDIIAITPMPREVLGVPEDAFVICMVSRAIPEKGWQEAIETVKLARKISRKDIHLLLIGTGPEYDRLTPIIEDKFIHLLGFKANVRDYFAASDIGFLPSRYPAESFPLVVIECLHSNRPILASNLGEIKNMISTSEGKAGSVFDLDNWNIPIAHVAQLIVNYVENSDLYRDHLCKVSEAASKFDPLILLEKYEGVYLELIKKSCSPAVDSPAT